MIKSKKVLYGALLVVLIAGVIFFLPIWSIQDIQVNDLEVYTKEDIIKASKIQPNAHILTVNRKRAAEAIKELTYILDANITYHFPNKLEIDVVENKPMGYVEFLGSFLCIGEKGQVLEQVTQPYLELPILEGLKFTKFTVGEVLPLENEDHFLAVVEIMNGLKKHDFVEKIDIIDVSNLEQIHLYVGRLDVIIGNIRDFDKKVKWLVNIHQEYPMGVLDLSYIENGQAILTPLT